MVTCAAGKSKSKSKSKSKGKGKGKGKNATRIATPYRSFRRPAHRRRLLP
jgi:hypothetical protein